MRFKGKRVTTAAMILLVTTANAFAAVVDNTDGKGVTVSGNIGEANVPISLEVYVKGKTAADLKGLSEEEKLAIVVAYDGAMTDADGNYSFSFDIAQGSGEYTAYAATADKTLEAESFVFVGKSDFESVVDAINAAADKTEVENYIKSQTYALGLTEDDIKNVSTSGVAEILYNSKTKTPLDKTSREKVYLISRRALYIQKLNEKKISDIYGISDDINALGESKVSNWYKKDYVTSNLKSDFTNRMSGQGFKSIDEYLDYAAEAFVLSTVRYPNGNGNVEDIVNAFKTEIGLSGVTIKDSVWTKIAGLNIKTFSELKSKIESLNKESLSGSGASSGGGSKGGGGYSTVSDVEISGQDKNDDKPTIPLDIFSDLDGFDWAKQAITAIAERKIILGDGNGKFRPNDNITREEFCKLVVTAFRLTENENTVAFVDVENGEWYAEFVNTAAANGVVNGIGEGMFGVESYISREDMAVMLYRAYTVSGNLKRDEKFEFADDNDISDYAKDAVYALREKGVINGIDNEHFAPKDFATRAEAAKMIYGLIQD